jgi:hypothetical protein
MSTPSKPTKSKLKLIKSLKEGKTPTILEQQNAITNDERKTVIKEKKNNTAYGKYLESYTYSAKRNVVENNLTYYIHKVNGFAYQKLKTFIEQKGPAKFSFVYNITMKNSNNTNVDAAFYSESPTITQVDDIKSQFSQIKSKIDKDINEFNRKGSGKTIVNINHAYFNIGVWNPIVSHAAGSWFELPKDVRKSKALVNIKNEDNECFKWCVLAHLYPQSDHKERVSKYKKYSNELKFPEDYNPAKGFEPYGTNVKKFEELNNIGISVYTQSVKGTTPLSVTRKIVPKERHVHLLYIVEDEKVALDFNGVKREKKKHFVLITDFQKFMYDPKNRCDVKFCRFCLCKFSPDKYAKHTNGQEAECFAVGEKISKIILPKKGSKIEFKDTKKWKMKRYPVVIYADTESILVKPWDTEEYKNTIPEVLTEDNDKIFNLITDFADISHCKIKTGETIKYQAHKMSSYCYTVVLSEEAEKIVKLKHKWVQPSQTYVYRGVDAGLHFVKSLQKRCKSILSSLMYSYGKDKMPVVGNDGKVQVYKNGNIKMKTPRVKEFEGIPHNQFKVPIFMHNLKGYDAHPILLEIANICQTKGETLDCIPSSGEKFVSFSTKQMVFKDSMSFMGSSLDNLARNLLLKAPKEILDTKDAEKIADYETKNFKETRLYYKERLTIPKDWKAYNAKKQYKYMFDQLGYNAFDIEDEMLEAVTIEKKQENVNDLAGYENPMEDDLELCEQQPIQVIEEKVVEDDEFRNKFEYSYERIRMLTEKGSYPYEHFDHHERFNDTSIPSYKTFLSTLNNCKVDGIDYNADEKAIISAKKAYDRACSLYNEFKCRNLGMYSDLYVTTDTLILADIFEKFRTTCMETYQVDPASYYTLPGYSWDCCLKMSKAKIDPFTEGQEDMLHFAEKGIRGGISMISNRYGKANNIYTRAYTNDKKDDKSECDSYLMYYDANALYSKAMTEYLPYDNYRWVTGDKNFKIIKDKLNERKYTGEEDDGYFLEVDIDYPKELHDAHNDYPCAPEPVVVTLSMMSPYTKMLKSKISKLCNNIKPGTNEWDNEDYDDKIDGNTTEKLICRLTDKKNYVVHYRTLMTYIEQGLKVSKIHRILKFSQKPWMREFIKTNIENRKKAANPFEKDLYKLMNNAVFGKTMENVRKRKKLRLITNEKDLVKGLNDIRCGTWDEIKGGLVIMNEHVGFITMDKAIMIGATILDISKVTMYSFHYNVMKKKYPGDKSKLLFTDTDSLCYELKCPRGQDIYEDIANSPLMLSRLDTSCYDNPIYQNATRNGIDGKGLLTKHSQDCKTKGTMGLFKDVMADEKYTMAAEFIGLRAKMYSILMLDQLKEKSTAKGVKKNAQPYIKHQKYKDCLMGEDKDKCQKITFNVIRSHKHELYSETLSKISLAASDDKFYQINNTDKLAYGHYRINEIELDDDTSDDFHD